MGSDDYTVIRQIGKGAFGIAYVVQHKNDGQRYVMKKVRLARQSPKERQASLRELQILSHLAHRNVLNYKESWVENKCIVCLVVEFCEGGDLLTQLKMRLIAQVHFSENHVQDIMCMLLSALAYLHQNNILHRDIKSSNVLITADGCLKLADFGLATVLDDEDLGMKHTIVGTPNYMGPELLSDKPYGKKNDIWALGCVIVEVASLKPAFQAFNMPGLIKKITQGSTPVLPSSYSPALRALVRSMLAKEPEDRPSAEDLLASDVLQASAERTAARFGEPLPEGCPEFVTVAALPSHIAALDDRFKQQEKEAEEKAKREKLRRKGLFPPHVQASPAPVAPRRSAKPPKPEPLLPVIKAPAGGIAPGPPKACAAALPAAAAAAQVDAAAMAARHSAAVLAAAASVAASTAAPARLSAAGVPPAGTAALDSAAATRHSAGATAAAARQSAGMPSAATGTAAAATNGSSGSKSSTGTAATAATAAPVNDAPPPKHGLSALLAATQSSPTAISNTAAARHSSAAISTAPAAPTTAMLNTSAPKHATTVPAGGVAISSITNSKSKAVRSLSATSHVEANTISSSGHTQSRPKSNDAVSSKTSEAPEPSTATASASTHTTSRSNASVISGSHTVSENSPTTLPVDGHTSVKATVAESASATLVPESRANAPTTLAPSVSIEGTVSAPSAAKTSSALAQERKASVAGARSRPPSSCAADNQESLQLVTSLPISLPEISTSS